MESGAAFLDSVSFNPPSKHAPHGSATWNLPATKSDPMALGKTRTLCCSCPAKGCAVCALRRVYNISHAMRCQVAEPGTEAYKEWPLIITCAGHPMSKAQVIAF